MHQEAILYDHDRIGAQMTVPGLFFWGYPTEATICIAVVPASGQ